MRTLSLPFRSPLFFQGLEFANTGYGTSIYFNNRNLQYFALLLDNNIIFANRSVIFNNYDYTVKPRFYGLMRKCNCPLLEKCPLFEKTLILPSVDTQYTFWLKSLY